MQPEVEALKEITIPLKEYDDLRRDNAKLREDVRLWKEAWHDYRAIVGQLGLDNLKRRLIERATNDG